MPKAVRVLHTIAALILVVFFSAARSFAATDPEPSPVVTPADAPDAARRDSGADPQDTPQSDVDYLRLRFDLLAAEVERLRSGEPETTELSEQQRRALGVAPSAAATYRRKTEGVSFAGYGEMLLEKSADRVQSGAKGGSETSLDFLRAVVYAGYRFNDKFLFNSEIEFEHGGEKVGIEFAYLDYLVRKNVTIRGGMMLLPLGLVNEFHEPTAFIGARRPETEWRILPSPWHGNGAVVLANFGLMNVRAYVVNGLKAEGFAASGLREGRQGGAEANAKNLAATGRVDLTPIPGVFGGIGLYRGGASQGAITSGNRTVDVTTTIVELHGQAQIRGFDVRGLFANASIDDAAALNRALERLSDEPVAERMRGGYVQVGYNLLSQTSASISLTPFVRFEHVDTQNRVPAGFTRDLSLDGNFKTLGVELKPIANVVIKADYQWTTNQAGTGRNQFNVNLGYAF